MLSVRGVLHVLGSARLLSARSLGERLILLFSVKLASFNCYDAYAQRPVLRVGHLFKSYALNLCGKTLLAVLGLREVQSIFFEAASAGRVAC